MANFAQCFLLFVIRLIDGFNKIDECLFDFVW